MPRSHAAVDPQAEAANVEPIEEQNALPLDLLSMMSVLQPGDSAALARLLAAHPSFHEQILERAAKTLGNKTVQDALAMESAGAATNGTGDPRDAAAASVQGATAPTPGAGPSVDVRAQYADAANAPGNEAEIYKDDVLNDQKDAVTTAPVPTQYVPPKESAAQTLDEITPNAPGTFGAVKHLVWGAVTVEDLATILKGYPQFRQQIIDEAQSRHNLGPDEIQRAVGMADAPAGGAAQQQEEQQPPPQPAPSEPQPGDAAPGLTAADPKREAAWIGQANAYNAEHAELVGEFNILTDFVCMTDGATDATKVAQWQKANGLEADGKIGHHTVAAARHSKPPSLVDANQAAQDALPDDDLRKEAV